jgi:hypothetical protein
VDLGLCPKIGRAGDALLHMRADCLGNPRLEPSTIQIGEMFSDFSTPHRILD